MEPHIHLAFRFHVNFYHSYRGDTPDELGFGKDIRVIRHIIDVLDRLNAQGCAIRGTWDIENVFSLGRIMPEHAPDLVAALQRRVRAGDDEIEVMSYNNGLISAHTAREFEVAICRALHNTEGSGLRDVFDDVRPVVRPQEMMFTPLHMKLYRAYGIDAISLFYSAVPFNSFSNFITPLPLLKRYNPLTMTYAGIDETLTLIPAYNHGDIADHISLRRWVTTLRRQQLEMATPTDLLLLIDADADDDYWAGYDWPILRSLLSAAQGLEGLVNNIADLGYVQFTTPHRYLQTHAPVGTLSFGQDTADGNFDGMASWAEKWSNHHLWTGIDRSRILEQQTLALTEGQPKPQVADLLSQTLEARIRALSTTHFGLAAPVMNKSRLTTATELVATAFETSRQAFDLAVAPYVTEKTATTDGISFTLLDYARGIDTDVVHYAPKQSRTLVRLPLEALDFQDKQPVLTDNTGTQLPSAVRLPPSLTHTNSELCFAAALPGGARRTYNLSLRSEASMVPIHDPVHLRSAPLQLANQQISVTFNQHGHPIHLDTTSAVLEAKPLLRSAIRYKRREFEVHTWHVESSEILGDGALGAITMTGTIPLADTGMDVRVSRDYIIAAGLPYLYVTTEIAYPATPDHAKRNDVVRRLERTYDDRWQEVMPCEIRPGLVGRQTRPIRIWKHNYLDHVSSYDLSQGTFEGKHGVDAFNNQITHGWVAVTDQETGLLISHSADAATCFAFCPMRTRRSGDLTALYLNPFGTYFGRQMAYPTATTGLGKRVAVLMAETLRSPAPSYSGHQERLSLMLAPYTGDRPPSQLQADAEAFAYPYALLSASPSIGTPDHRTWPTENCTQ